MALFQKEHQVGLFLEAPVPPPTRPGLGETEAPLPWARPGHSEPSQVVSWSSRAGAAIAVTLISRALETETAHS